MTATDLDWAKLWVTLITAIVAAAVAGFFALRQYQISRDKLRLDLFEKRMEVYNKFEALINEFAVVFGHHRPDRQDYLDRLRELEALPTYASFIFGPDIEKVIEDFLSHASLVLEAPDFHEWQVAEGDNEHAIADKKASSKAYDKSLIELGKMERWWRDPFAPYLSFNRWK